MRPWHLSIVCAILLPIAAQAQSSNMPKKSVVARKSAAPSAAAVHRSAIIIDTHADTTQRMLDDHYDLTQPLDGGYVNFASAKAGNLGAEFFSIWVEPTLYKDHYARRTLDLIDAVRQQALAHPDQMMMAYSPEDILKAHREHKLAALMGIEGGHSIEDSLGLLRDYYRLGVRYMTLTWSNSNDWADSSGDADDPNVKHTEDGLTDFGKDVVYEMNRLGMMVDISHVSDKTFYRAVITSRAPVFASHSSARALCAAPRNMTDDMLRALAKKGGVVHINFYEGLLDADYQKRSSALKTEGEQQDALENSAPKFGDRTSLGPEERKIDDRRNAALGRLPLDRLLDHFEHAVKVAGIDHVGLGSDFDGANGQFPQGMEDISKIPNLVAGLMARGFSDQDILKILGGNTLRVMEQVERAAQR